MSWLHAVINFDDFFTLLPIVKESIMAATVLGLIAGLIGPMIQARDMAFAVHGTSELSFAGASFALWIGGTVTWGAIGGSLIGGLVLALMGLDTKNRNTVIGILLPFGLGLGILFLSLYEGRSSNKFGLLTGQIVSITPNELELMGWVAVIVCLVMLVFGRRLLFAAIDPAIAKSQRLNITALSLIFMITLSLVVAMSVHLVGALLVLSLLITPTAAAAKISASPLWIHLLSMIFAIVSAVGGILLSLGPGLPVSPYVTTISFLIYIFCWMFGFIRRRNGWSARLGSL